ncbi:MAG: biopolymer transporter ExbD [Bacteroidales bacterium]|jgi:biopolymer transport protein ExbD|nr:biopolymer transporter ExbD [Bacteroidales bacterium]
MAGSKKTPGINAASMADISFILLIFFLMVTTMGTDFGLIRQLPPMAEDQKNEDKINERNVFVVNVNQHDNIMAEKSYINISELRGKAKEFFFIGNEGDEFPEKEVKELPLVGSIKVNKTAVVSLQNDRGTSYKAYIQVQNELAGAVHELRNEFCLQHFGKKFDDCSQEEQDTVGKQIYPMAISEAEPKDAGGRRK